MNLDRWLTAKEACEVLGIDRASLYKLVEDCTIPTRYVYRIGTRGEYRIHPAAFDPLMTPEQTQPHPQTHTLLALIDRTMTNLTNDLDDLRRVRDIVAKGALPSTPRLLDSPLALSAD